MTDSRPEPNRQSQQTTPPATKRINKNANMKKMLTILLAGIITIAIFAALAGWKQWRQAGGTAFARPPLPVTAMVLSPAQVPDSLQAIGSLRAVREVSLTPETAGRVIDIPFEAGTWVESGSLLVQLNDAVERADRESASARANLAEALLNRSRRLAENGAESSETVDQRQAERDQAVAAVAQLDARIALKQIRAPFDGKLGIRQIDSGQYLNPGDMITQLTDTSELYVDFHLPQHQINRLENASAIFLTTDAWPDREFKASVDTIAATVDRGTRNIAIRGSLPNPDQALLPGMFVNVRLALPAQENQIVVPTTAIQTTAAGDSVLVIRGETPNTNGQVEFVRVTVARRLGDRAVISEGLKAGDVVITEGQLRLQPGAEVQVSSLQTTGESE